MKIVTKALPVIFIVLILTLNFICTLSSKKAFLSESDPSKVGSSSQSHSSASSLKTSSSSGSSGSSSKSSKSSSSSSSSPQSPTSQSNQSKHSSASSSNSSKSSSSSSSSSSSHSSSSTSHGIVNTPKKPTVPPKPGTEEYFWKEYFIQDRGEKCAGEKLIRDILKKLGVSPDGSFIGTVGKGPFYWVKEWGFGQSAYFFDYLDPVFRIEITKYFEKILKKFKGYPSANTSDYSDPFDLNKVRPGLDPFSKARVEKHIAKMKAKLDHEVYDHSINAVQLYTGIKELKWHYDKSAVDFAKAFVVKYDMNGDGRLSPRELILGSIWTNSPIFLSGDCKLCYEDIVEQLNGVFYYMDCDKDGLLSAEDIYIGLQKMRRKSKKHNFYLLSNIATIRTAVVNDFVLKNMESKRGTVNKNEFIRGILLGFWDRQTDDKKILHDDTRNLKALRWNDDEIVDTLAKKYVERVIISKAKELEAREKNYQNRENDKCKQQ